MSSTAFQLTVLKIASRNPSVYCMLTCQPSRLKLKPLCSTIFVQYKFMYASNNASQLPYHQTDDTSRRQQAGQCRQPAGGTSIAGRTTRGGQRSRQATDTRTARCSGPVAVWNTARSGWPCIYHIQPSLLPSSVRDAQSLAAFRQQLKTVLFTTSFCEDANCWAASLSIRDCF